MKKKGRYKKDKRVNKVIYVRLSEEYYRKLVRLANITTKGNQSGMARYLIEKGVDELLSQHERRRPSVQKVANKEKVKPLTIEQDVV